MRAMMTGTAPTAGTGPIDEALHDIVARLRDENAALKTRIAALERLADTDALTALPNRRAFVREVERAIARVMRYGATAALMYVDVDNLKAINDAHGHGAGDAVLRHLAVLLRAQLRAGDLVARIGGDEFALLVDPVDAAAAGAKGLAVQAAASAAGFAWQAQTMPIGISVGVTMIEATDTVDLLLARADARMYATKNGQRSER
jgi:diguanylate cyclase (GGDEF)-like protein